MKNTRKILIAVLVVMTLLVSLTAAIIPASAATTQKLYLKPNSNWTQSNAWFAVYYWNDSGNAWKAMTDSDTDGYYEVEIPTGYSNLIFCRMNSSDTSTLGWSNAWNQTSDLTVSAGKNCYTVASGAWSKGSGTWSSYTPACTNHNYDEYGLCTNSGCSAGCYYTVTGNSADVFGSAWTPNTGNKMHYDSATSTYIYVAEGVATGEYKFKCIKNGDKDWSGAIGGTGSNADADGNFVFNVGTDNSTVTIALKGGVISVSIEAPHVHSWSDVTCTEPQKCSCGETQGVALGHTAGDAATCTTAQTCTVCNAELAAALGHKDENNDYVCDVCEISICTTHEYTYACDKVCLNCNGITRPEAEHTVVHVDAVAATCTADGNVEYWYCSDCGYAWTDEDLTKTTNLLSVVTPAGHSIVVDEAVAATCTTEGKTAGQHCENCDDETVAQETVAALGHDAEDGSCSRCDYRFVYVVNSNEWSKINAYAWNDSGNNSWPGVAMTKTDDTVNGFEVYYIEFTAAYESIIFNDGSSQTADLALAPGKYFDLSNTAWYDSLDAVPTPDPLKTDDTLAGSFNGWNAGTHAFRLEEEGGSVSYIYLELAAETTYEFKIIKNGSWHGNSGTITDSVTGWDFKTSIDANCTITTTAAGTYVFALDGTKLSVTYPHVHSWSDATCTEPQKCSCGETQGEALGHTAGAAATCTAAQTCTVCGAELAAALGHKDENSDYICDVESCKAKLCTDHSEEAIPGKDATCSETGLTKGKKCSICGEILVAQEEIPANGHSYEAVILEPTCVAKGYTTYTCACGDSYTDDEVAATGKHTYVDGDCSVCGDIDLNNTVTVYFQNNWMWSDVCVYYWYGENNTPNASWPGVKAEKVGNDGTYDIYAAKIPVKVTGVIFNGIKDDGSGDRDETPGIKSGWTDCLCYCMAWDDGNQVKTFEYHVSNADDGDCTTEVTCSVCGTVTLEAKEDHTAGNAVKENELAASCTAAGYYDSVVYCSVCNKELSRETVDVEAFGHDIINDEAVAPTCTATGLTAGSHCSRCDGATVAQETIPALGHSYSAAVTAPTCTEKGYTTYTCSTCSNSYTDNEVAAKGHDIIVDAAKAPTCTDTGLSAGEHCTRCDYKVAQEVLPASGHSYKTVVTAPTCTEGGYATYTCSACGDSFVADEVEALGHTVVTDAGNAASCTETGLTEGKHCSVCDKVLVAQEVIPANGHKDENRDFACDVCGTDLCTEHTEEIVPGKAATCTETGLTDGKKCANCGDVIEAQQVIPATGHSYNAVVTDPTCTVDGYTTYTCSACDHSYVADKVVASGHSYDNGVVTKDPTCTEEGVKTFTCSCGDSYTEAVEKLSHSYDATITEPTCTEGGYTTYTCSACGHSYTADEVAAHGHSYSATATAPTCTEAGYTTYTCSACSNSYTDNEIDALGHEMITDAAVAPTCTETGLSEGSHCARCDHKVEQNVVDALGHDMITDAAVAPTCTATGLSEGSHCARCDHMIAQNEIPALGHKDENKNYICDVCEADLCTEHTEEVVPGKAATCTEPGLTEGKKCSVCGEVIVAQTVIDALGHTEVVDAAVAATCTEAGKTEGKHCSACNEVLVAQTEVAALGHDMQTHTQTLPTCEADGVEAGEECSRCDHKVGFGVIDALGHDFSEGQCTRCGETDPDYIAPEQPGDETPEQPDDEQPEEELNFFQKVVKAIADFFKAIGNWFKNLFAKK